MKASKKAARNLESRMRDYAETMNTKNMGSTKAEQRKESGGYHRPGSNKK